MRRSAVLLAILMLGVGFGWAGTTGQIIGTVVDDTGKPLPGVQVSVESPSLIGGSRTMMAGSTGSFQFSSLPPGDYTVRASLDGFATQAAEAVKVTLDEVTSLSFSMTRASFAGEVVVSSEAPVINVTKTALGEAYSAQFLQETAISSANRKFTNAIAVTPGTIQGGYYGEIEVFGSSRNENAYYIDGLSNTAPVTNTYNSRLNFDAIDEINVQTGGFNAEYGFAVGGVFNLVTKSGGNQFSGTFDARYIGENFTSSTEHFDANEDLYSYENFAATFGGPILQDKLWFFASLETYNQERRPADVIQTNTEDRLTGFAKLTWQASQSWRLVWKTNYDDWSNKYARAIPSVEPDADANDERTFLTNQLEASASLSDNLFLTLQAGMTSNQLDVVPSSGNYENIGHLDLVTGVFSVNYLDTQRGDENRDQFRGDLSWFVDDFGGTHQFKVGLDVSQVDFTNERSAPGGFNYIDQAGAPFVLQQIVPSTGEYKGDYQSYYLQDSWRPIANLTINIGVRYDHAKFVLETTGEEVADFDQFQPRLGLAWDATGDGKTVVRAFYGDFMHPSAMTLPLLAAASRSATYLNCTVLGFPDAATCEQLAPQFGLPFLADPGHFPGTGWALVDPGGAGGLVVASGLQAPKAVQWTLGIEREIYRNTSLGLQYVDKTTDRFFDTTCNGNVPEPSEGAECNYLLITNDIPAKRDYTGWILTFKSQAVDNLNLLASYVYSDSKGSLGLTQGASVDFDVYPIHFDNRYGYLPNHRQHQFKLNGYWAMPLRFSLGFGFDWQSELPWTLQDGIISQGNGTYFVGPRGSEEGDDYYQLDLQLAKAFAIGGSWDLQLILSVLNVTNAQNGTVVCESIYGCLGTLQPGDNMEWQLPRRFELGVRVTF